MDVCTHEEGEGHEGAVMPWRSLFCGGDRKWGVMRSTLGAGVGLDGWGEREVTKTAPDQPASVGLFDQGYDGNFALVESESREISMEAGDFAADLKICNTVLPVRRVG